MPDDTDPGAEQVAPPQLVPASLQLTEFPVWLLFPYKAREQLTTSVAARYRSAVVSDPASDGMSDAMAQLLTRFQELLRSASESTGLERRLLVFAPAILNQGLPYLGFLISPLLKQLTL